MVTEQIEQAVALHRGGDLDGAAEVYRQVLAADPGNPDAHHLLGLCAHQRGQYGVAVAEIGRAIAGNAGVPAYHGNLGLAQYALGEHAAAEESFRKALDLDPAYHPARFNLASLLAIRGEHEHALASYERLLAAQDPSPLLLAKCAESLRALGRLDDAVARYRQALPLAPGDPDLLGALAVILDLKGEEDAALATLSEALERRPDFVGAMLNMAKILRDQGRAEEALAACRRALQLQPGSPEALAGIVNVYERMGEFGQAWEQLRPALAKAPDSPPLALAFAALAHRYDAESEALAALRRCDELPDVSPLMRQKIQFSWANMLDRRGDHAGAFDHLRHANALSPQGFDIAAYEHLSAGMQQIYAAPETLARSTCVSERPVFIVGMPRSGTSLVEQILASHPEIHGAGELSAIADIAVGLPAAAGLAGDYPDMVPQLTAGDLDAAAARYLQVLQGLNDSAPRVTDKMPTNFLDLGLIAQMLPRARVIHVRREPLDTCLSCYFQNSGARLRFTSDLEILGRYYLAYDRVMRHWRQTLPVPMLEIRYEQLVDDLEGVSRSMVAFLGLAWDPACLQFHASDRFVRTASYDQVREPIYRRSVGRWQAYAEQLAPLQRLFAGAGLA